MIIYIRACFVFVFAVTWSLFVIAGWGWRARPEGCQGRKRRACEWCWLTIQIVLWCCLSVSGVRFCCFAHCFLFVNRVLLVHLGLWVPSVSPVLLWVQVSTLQNKNQRVCSASWFYLYFLFIHAANSIRLLFYFWDIVFNNISHVFWCRVLMESLDREASRGLLELKVMKDPEDSQEPQDPSDCR